MLLLGFARNALPPDGGEDAAASKRLLAVNDPGRDVRPLGKTEGHELVDRLRRLAAGHLRQLRAERRESADPLEQRARAVATAAAMAHASKDAQLRHRYEMDIDRVLRGTVNQLVVLTKSGVDLAGEDAATGPVEVAPATSRPEADPVGTTRTLPNSAKGVTTISPVPSGPSIVTAPGSVGADDLGMIPTAVAVPIGASKALSRAPKRSRRRRSRR
jgi:hypothetical protein